MSSAFLHSLGHGNRATRWLRGICIFLSGRDQKLNVVAANFDDENEGGRWRTDRQVVAPSEGCVYVRAQ